MNYVIPTQVGIHNERIMEYIELDSRLRGNDIKIYELIMLDI